jgi:site-specific recombinase XerD
MGSSGDTKKQPPRRDRGVFERPKGSGVWWVRYTDENGRLHREKVGTKSLALKVYTKRKSEVQERRFFPERIGRREMPVADMIDDYLDRNRKTLRHFYHYERHARRWKKALKGKALRQVTPGDIERYVATRIGEVAPATVNRELAFIKRVFTVAIADGMADSNPVRAVRLFRENNARVRFLTDEEEKRLRGEIGDDNWPLVAIALHTGLRQAEQFNLKWEDVDFGTRQITVKRAKHGELRRVTMNDVVRDWLRANPSRLKGEYVFPSQTGSSAIAANNFMRRVFKPALERAEIEDFRWHDLRHCFASRLVMAGVDLRTVQELMGHKTITMTLRYAHLSPQHQLDAVQRLAQRPTDTSTDTDVATGADDEERDTGSD